MFCLPYLSLATFGAASSSHSNSHGEPHSHHVTFAFWGEITDIPSHIICSSPLTLVRCLFSAASAPSHI